MAKQLKLYESEPGNDQSSFWDRLEDLLHNLNADKIPPERVHTITHNTRAWMAVIIVEK